MSAGHTPGPTRQQMLSLQAAGYVVKEAWYGEYYDGLQAVKRIGAHIVEVYAGGAADGNYSDMHYPPVVYVDNRRVADSATLERAARIAGMRVWLIRAAIAKAEGGAA